MVEVASLVLTTGESLAPPLGRQFMYLYNYTTNFKNLQDEISELKSAKKDVDLKVTYDKTRVELEIRKDVKDWQMKVSLIIDEAEKLIEKNANPACFKGFCPNLISRYKHSRKAFKLKLESLGPLLQEGKKFDKVSYSIMPINNIQQEIWQIPTKEILYAESRKSTLQKVWDALKDNNIYMIGVYGVGGVGKTALVQGVHCKAMNGELFDKIVFIQVTETTNIEEIQTQIAESLRLELNDQSETASQICASLSKNEKILLILDNVLKYIDFKSVGIPSEADRGGCKLLLTTKKVAVLKKMGSKNNFQINFLNDEEIGFHFFSFFSLVFAILIVCFVFYVLPYLQKN